MPYNSEESKRKNSEKLEKMSNRVAKTRQDFLFVEEFL